MNCVNISMARRVADCLTHGNTAHALAARLALHNWLHEEKVGALHFAEDAREVLEPFMPMRPSSRRPPTSPQ